MNIAYGISSLLLYPMCYHVLHYRRKIVSSNIAKCFPEKSEDERQQIERTFYHRFADMIVEAFYGRHLDAAAMARHFALPQQEAEQLAQDAHTHGGLIITTGHMFNWEWINDFGNKLTPYEVGVGGVYKPLSSPFFNKLMLKVRQGNNVCMIDNRLLLRTMVRFRKEQKPMVYGLIADQRPEPQSNQLKTTLLGQEVGMITGPESLGRKFEYPIYYGQIVFVRRGFYQVNVTKIYDPEVEKDLPEGVITQRYTDCLEKNIIIDPANWLWSHNRFWKSN